MFEQTRLHANEFENEYEGGYEGEYEGEFENEYEGEYEGEFENEYEGEYEGEFENEYEGEYEGEYESGRSRSHARRRAASAPPPARRRAASAPPPSRRRAASVPPPAGRSSLPPRLAARLEQSRQAHRPTVPVIREERARRNLQARDQDRQQRARAARIKQDRAKFNRAFPQPERSRLRTQDDRSLPNRQPSMMNTLTRRKFIRGMTSQNADRGDAIFSGRNNTFRPRLGYHMTPSDNLRSIQETGLDPALGGQGASVLSRNPRMIQNSRERVHYTDNLGGAGSYGNFLNEGGNLHHRTGSFPPLVRNSNISYPPTLLGVRIPNSRTIDTDPDDPRNAYRTSGRIPPEQITRMQPITQDAAMRLGRPVDFWQQPFRSEQIIARQQQRVNHARAAIAYSPPNRPIRRNSI